MAEILKIDQSTVVRKLNKYKLITEERDPDPQS
jgi:hypothetical protein